MAKEKFTITGLTEIQTRSGKLVLDLGVKEVVGASKKIGGKANPLHTRTIIDTENLGLVISPNSLIQQSNDFEALHRTNPELFNKIYSAIVKEVDSAFRVKMPTTLESLKALKDGVYNFSSGNERLIIAYTSDTSGSNFAKIQTKFSTIIKNVERRFSKDIDSTIGDLLVLNSFFRVFKGNVKIKGTIVAAKAEAVRIINSRIKSDKIIKESFEDAGLPTTFTEANLDTAYLKKASKLSGYNNYDIIFSTFVEEFTKVGLLQDVRVGLEIGHIGGVGGRIGGTGGVSSPGELKLSSIYELVLQDKKLRSDKLLLDKINKGAKSFETDSIDLDILRNFNSVNPGIDLILAVPQSFAINNKAATASQSQLKPVFDHLKKYGVNVAGSPSLLGFINTTILSAITNGKIKPPKNEKNKSSLTKKLYDNYKAKRANTRTIKVPKYKSNAEQLPKPKLNKNLGEDTFALRNLINEILAEQVEAQMADSAATDGRLRYQTGRFADSAKLLTLTRTQAGVLAGQYTYMRDPYDVFLPGHKMGTPKRDPRIYVEGAIRQSAMSILKKRFPGIALELK